MAQFSLKAADSSVVPITSLTLGTVYEKQQADSAREKARQDSVRQVQRQDSIRRANPDAARPPAPAAAAPPTRRLPGAPPARDTTPPPKPSAPIPESYAIIRLGQSLKPATSYRLRADSLKSLMGIARSSERVFTTAKPRPVSDTTRPPGDSTRRPPGDSTRRPPGDSARPPVRRPPGAGDHALRIVHDLFEPVVRQ
jgi:hypothetical protein